jgi:hypothetical protein
MIQHVQGSNPCCRAARPARRISHASARPPVSLEPRFPDLFAVLPRYSNQNLHCTSSQCSGSQFTVIVGFFHMSYKESAAAEHEHGLQEHGRGSGIRNAREQRVMYFTQDCSVALSRYSIGTSTARSYSAMRVSPQILRFPNQILRLHPQDQLLDSMKKNKTINTSVQSDEAYGWDSNTEVLAQGVHFLSFILKQYTILLESQKSSICSNSVRRSPQHSFSFGNLLHTPRKSKKCKSIQFMHTQVCY